MTFSLQLLDPSLPTFFSFKTVSRESRPSMNSYTRSSFFSYPTSIMGPRHCYLLSHYWQFIKIPYSMLADLNESLSALIAKTNYFTCVLHPCFPVTFHNLLLSHLVPLAILPMHCKHVLPLPSCSPTPQKREGNQLFWLDSAAILETNYFSPSIQCQTCEKIYFSTSIFLAALCPFISYLLAYLITKTL